LSDRFGRLRGRFAILVVLVVLAIPSLAHAQKADGKEALLTGDWLIENHAGRIAWTIRDNGGAVTATGEGTSQNDRGQTFATTYRCTGSRTGEKLILDCKYNYDGGDDRTSKMILSILDQNTMSRDGMSIPVVMKRK
jgi:hypothetical protein